MVLHQPLQFLTLFQIPTRSPGIQEPRVEGCDSSRSREEEVLCADTSCRPGYAESFDGFGVGVDFLKHDGFLGGEGGEGFVLFGGFEEGEGVFVDHSFVQCENADFGSFGLVVEVGIDYPVF